MCVGSLAGVTYLRYTVLTSANKSETAVHFCDPALSVLVMLVSRNVFRVVSALQSIVFVLGFCLSKLSNSMLVPLCCVVLCCVTLYNVLICCAMSHYVVLCCPMLCYDALCCLMLSYVVLCCAMLCYFLLCCTMLSYVVLCCARLRHAVLCCAVVLSSTMLS